MIKDFLMRKLDKFAIFNEGIFVFDTSALLNIFEFNWNEIRHTLDDTFSCLKDSIYIPKQVNDELVNGISKTKKDVSEKYNGLLNNLKSIDNNFKQILDKTKDNNKHPFVDRQEIDLFNTKLESFSNIFESSIKDKISEIQDENSEIDRLLKCFLEEKCEVLPGFNFQQKIQICKEGELRYKNEIPPGYNDSSKPGFQKYGDLILWNEVLNLVKSKKKPLIFITDDCKEDWWICDDKKQPIRSRYELEEELFSYTNQHMLMFTLSGFLKELNEVFNKNVDESIIRTADEIARQTQKKADKISITASFGEVETARINRLKSLLNDISRYHGLNLSKIDGLHDHKGELTITWNSIPTLSEKRIIQNGWENQNEYIVSHEYKSIDLE